MQKTLHIARLLFLLFIILKISTALVAGDKGNDEEEIRIKESLSRLSIERESRLCWQMYSEWEKAALEEIHAKTDQERAAAIKKQHQALDAWDAKMQIEKNLIKSG